MGDASSRGIVGQNTKWTQLTDLGMNPYLSLLPVLFHGIIYTEAKEKYIYMSIIKEAQNNDGRCLFHSVTFSFLILL